ATNVAVLADAYRNDIAQNGDIDNLSNEIDQLVAPGEPPETAWEQFWTDSKYAQMKARLSSGTLIRLMYGDIETKFVQHDKSVTLTKVQQSLVQQLDALPALGGLLRTWVNRDHDPAANPRVIPVAAAGNGLDFDPAQTAPTQTQAPTPTPS